MNVTLGALVAAAGIALAALGLPAGGRVRRPFHARRAHAAERRRYPVALRRACDMAIAEARRRAGAGEPAIVRTDAVLELMRGHFGFPYARREDAAVALYGRFRERGCAVDCVTDA
ncbi:hypothetical protein [Streptomyces xanthii]|uniref:Uncharacterized protein n=1 Tax=Streptomyces xanthii TaxID=2768069 RepID=A0A7H1B4E5_9ACTN|nr:hypothetical protein [Streptomyces xanthii]QNS03600.1 hypothetical protein IAG42_08150 [Streptomyces xanthii]